MVLSYFTKQRFIINKSLLCDLLIIFNIGITRSFESVHLMNVLLELLQFYGIVWSCHILQNRDLSSTKSLLCDLLIIFNVGITRSSESVHLMNVFLELL